METVQTSQLIAAEDIKQEEHLVLDCETFATTPRALPVTMALARVARSGVTQVRNPNTQMWEIIYGPWIVDPDGPVSFAVDFTTYGNDWLAKRFDIDLSTVLFHLGLAETFKVGYTNHPKGEPIAIAHAIRSMFTSPRVVGIWGYGADFDNVIFNNFLKVFNELPSQSSKCYRKTRCLRTLAALYPEVVEGIQFEGIKHTAKDDAIHQAKMLAALLNHLEALEAFEEASVGRR